MNKNKKPFFRFILIFSVSVFILSFVSSTIRSALAAQPTVGLYDIFELQVINPKSYSNPFDFQVIELQADFTAPSGQKYSFFGFYDGDGNGGATGNVWKLRFPPNETGTWTYAYSWTDGTPGGSGSFEVVDTGLSGPLRIAVDNPWFFADARGNPFQWRGYSAHLYLQWKYGRGIKPDFAWADLQDKINTKVADRGYNALMLEWPVINQSGWPPAGSNNGHHFWQQNGNTIDFSRFYIPQWRNVEVTLQTAAVRGVYVFQFLALADQFTRQPDNNQMTMYLRYMAARLGPYWNNFGYSLSWEYQDVWTEGYVNLMMGQLDDNLNRLPNPPLLSIHDHSNNLFANWLDFSMRQLQSKNIFDGNMRSGGKHGGVGSNFLDSPIVGSEDIWETCGNFGDPCNGTEARRAAWGLQMAGVMPVYMEDTGTTGVFNGQGEPDIRHMFDFFYTKTRYRQYQQLNSLVSAGRRQIASGIPGVEYLVYDEDGGNITLDLSGVPASTMFPVLWFNPATGVEQSAAGISGGAARTLTSPFAGDSVLLVGTNSLDPSSPSAPSNLTAVSQSDSVINLTWTAASDAESGISNYKIYRDGIFIGQTTGVGFSDTGLQSATAYTYRVSAVNGSGQESPQSSPASAATQSDTTPPTVGLVGFDGNPATQIKIFFSEPVESASSTNTANYSINNGISISAAAVSADFKMVTLTTSVHTPNTTYILTVNNIKDQAASPNTIVANTQVTYKGLKKTWLPQILYNLQVLVVSAVGVLLGAVISGVFLLKHYGLLLLLMD